MHEDSGSHLALPGCRATTQAVEYRQGAWTCRQRSARAIAHHRGAECTSSRGWTEVPGRRRISPSIRNARYVEAALTTSNGEVPNIAFVPITYSPFRSSPPAGEGGDCPSSEEHSNRASSPGPWGPWPGSGLRHSTSTTAGTDRKFRVLDDPGRRPRTSVYGLLGTHTSSGPLWDGDPRPLDTEPSSGAPTTVAIPRAFQMGELLYRTPRPGPSVGPEAIEVGEWGASAGPGRSPATARDFDSLPRIHDPSTCST